MSEPKSESVPTQEELEALLKQAGVSSGGWQPAGGQPTHMPFVKPQLDNLIKLRDYFSGLTEGDNQTVARLREQLARLQRGGGA